MHRNVTSAASSLTWKFQKGVNNTYTPKKTNMTIGNNKQFEDVFPIETGDYPMSFVSFQGCNWDDPPSFSNGCFSIQSCFFFFFFGSSNLLP